ncbi:discoidin domain-containing protein [Candidatus Sumerlaeota bacterium]|nr:discoidin domain-containing protein [Candidatus Sumerlaeota bacterium]
MIPVSYKSCDSRGNLDYSAKNLWDNKNDPRHKWCCFHAGYQTPQAHWVIMDLGRIYPISRIVIHHEGNTTDQIYLLTEDFRILGSVGSMEGPWFLVSDIKDNAQPVTTIKVSDTRMRYIGLEVTDSQYGEGPNNKQDDWAVRICEMYIYARETPSANATPVVPFNTTTPKPVFPANPGNPGNNPSLPKTPNVFSPLNNPELFQTGKKLYYFYNPNVVKCQDLEKMLASEAVQKSLLPYKMERVLSKTEEPRLRQFAVFIVPTLIITDANDKILKRTSTIPNEEEMINFLK